MTMTPVYLLNFPGNPTIQISQDELRSLLGEIEVELHRSQVYRQALAILQKLLGSSDEKAKILFKAVGREAIGLAFQKFARQHQTVADINPQLDVDAAVTPKVEQEQSSDASQYLTSIESHPEAGNLNPSEGNLPLESKLQVANTAVYPASSREDKALKRTKTSRLPWNKKTDTIEQANQRLARLHQIGKQLKLAREAQNLSLAQLYVYTHISLHHMEAVENGNLDLLPEDVLIRGFIRVMGNALGVNGTILAASLPATNSVKSVLPSWHQSKKTSGVLALEIHPIHLYLGYTALVAGAVGGLSLISQQANSEGALKSDVVIPAALSPEQSPQKTEATIKPGIKSNSTGISAGGDIAPPETL
ncbi:hypothetical protein Cylst_1175 [Cylindrospermum stagnale PCC 7417]|uniref:Helix-turn-helix protein n=1 Tax=Cylindrospermum stagnale PCC 7417 TaxID=56107 RepID=K9WVD6_9NOST|nr:helix-turn-helix domain-containing protein [Cylindrospermum stagnale]AFZ23477.1 hypothetical protein Cylst_1175 [Cylindrospermum stagnale PCC 7417]